MEHLWSLSNMTRVHVDSGLPYTKHACIICSKREQWRNTTRRKEEENNNIYVNINLKAPQGKCCCYSQRVEKSCNNQFDIPFNRLALDFVCVLVLPQQQSLLTWCNPPLLFFCYFERALKFAMDGWVGVQAPAIPLKRFFLTLFKNLPFPFIKKRIKPQ